VGLELQKAFKPNERKLLLLSQKIFLGGRGGLFLKNYYPNERFFTEFRLCIFIIIILARV
jgi:hypothetical protein